MARIVIFWLTVCRRDLQDLAKDFETLDSAQKVRMRHAAGAAHVAAPMLSGGSRAGCFFCCRW